MPTGFSPGTARQLDIAAEARRREDVELDGGAPIHSLAAETRRTTSWTICLEKGAEQATARFMMKHRRV